MVASICKIFWNTLLEQRCPEDVQTRLTTVRIQDGLNTRFEQALEELERLIQDKKDFPMVYNHYYTDTVQKKRHQRLQKTLQTSVKFATSHRKLEGCQSSHTSAAVEIPAAVADFFTDVDRDMEQYSCKKILDHFTSMYKVSPTR